MANTGHNPIDKAAVYIECGPLLHEREYSGIPSVVAHFVHASGTYLGAPIRFFHGASLLCSEAILEAAKQKSSHPIRECEEKGQLIVGGLHENIMSERHPTIGIFTNARHKLRRSFSYECQIIYDLTPIIVPEFHHPDTVAFHGPAYLEETGDADLLVCISECTRNDVVTYLGVNEEKTMVAYPAVGLHKKDIESVVEALGDIDVEPYMLVMGTIEPRKNYQLIFEYINKHPEVLERYKLVVVGRDGWLVKFEDLLGMLKNVPRRLLSRIVRVGYVEESTKLALLRYASFLVFPSFYEGFGLPVLEALSEGCPVLASCSSSIPEVGGEVCEYFDPHSIVSFEGALSRLESRICVNRRGLEMQCVRRAERFTWEEFVITIYGRIQRDAEQMGILLSSNSTIPMGD